MSESIFDMMLHIKEMSDAILNDERCEEENCNSLVYRAGLCEECYNGYVDLLMEDDIQEALKGGE